MGSVSRGAAASPNIASHDGIHVLEMLSAYLKQFLSPVPRIRPSISGEELRAAFAIRTDLEQSILERLRVITGNRYALLLPYGRSAIALFCRALLTRSKPEVLMPAYNCVVVANAAAANGMIPRFVDVRLSDGNIDPEKLARAAKNHNSELLIVTHMYGNSCDLDDILRIRKRADIRYLMCDAALALYSYHKGRHVCQFGDVSLLSFSTGKHLTAIEGGALLTDDRKIFSRLEREYRAIQKPATPFSELSKLGFVLGIAVTYGLNTYAIADYLYHRTSALNFLTGEVKRGARELPLDVYQCMTAIQQRVLATQMSRESVLFSQRNLIQKRYLEANFPSAVINASAHSNQLSHFSIRVTNRDGLVREGLRRGIFLEGPLFDYAIPDLSQYREFAEGRCDSASRLAQTVVNLPSYPDLSQDQQERVIGLVQDFTRRHGGAVELSGAAC